MLAWNSSWLGFALFLGLCCSGLAGQDCHLNRFVFLADGQEVLDRSTRLIWQRCEDGKRYLDGACAFDAGFAQTSRTPPWRLPSKEELQALRIAQISPKKTGSQDSKPERAVDQRLFPATHFDRFDFEGGVDRDNPSVVCYFSMSTGQTQCHRPLASHFRAVKIAPAMPLPQEAGLPIFDELKICPAVKH
jgi:Protein of unknown function (DUF1566)